MKKAFTLIELLMVIAIIGIISTLAVSKLGGVRESAARKVSLANQIAVERAVSAALSSGARLNRLDSLVTAQGADGASEWRHAGREGGGAGFDCTHTNAAADELYLGPTRDFAASTAEMFREEFNAGVTPELRGVLCPYTLNHAQADALVSRLGLRFVMAHNAYAGDPAEAYSGRRGADGAYVESRGDGGRDANDSACMAVAVTNGMALFAVNPVVERGRAIYRACGQELLRTEDSGVYEETSAVDEVNQTGGPLLALGLSDHASIVGKANAGLETAPFATYPARRYYGRYILLIRMKTAGSVVVPELAGAIDPCGHTVGAARSVIQSL